MKLIPPLLGLTTALVLAAPVHAQFVKGNEAVTVTPDGRVVAGTPPMPSATLRRPCKAAEPACTASGWRMVETDRGLQECTELYARPGTCRPSTYGTEARPRLWVVKRNGQWVQCQRPDIGSKCFGLDALPTSIVQ